MHETLTFLLPCSSEILNFKKVNISEVNGELYILAEKTDENIFDAFDHPELIPELMGLVRKAEQGKDIKKLAEYWVRKWGFLHGENINEHFAGQTIGSFWRDAQYFAKSWDIYKKVANRDIEFLKNFFEIRGGLKPMSEDPTQNYQWNTLRELIPVIETYTRNGILTASEIRRDEVETEVGIGDNFTLTPTYCFFHLIDTIYMQFFISLTANKKVCPVCDKPFTPKRKDRVYCSDSCKLTARSRRYRGKV